MAETDSKVARIDADELREFTRSVLRASGVNADHAETVADGLVRANLRGVDSHGVARLDAYTQKFVEGGFNTDPDMSVDQLADGAFRVDADDGPGQSAGMLAMEKAMSLADDVGIAAGVVRNSNHFGTAAYYTEHASSNGYLGIAMTNVGPDVVPFNGRDPFLGTNPLSFSAPTNREFPFTLDMATSVVAMGKIDHVAKEENADIPAEWAVDAAGEPTTDPQEVAALRPMGGPKGYGLGLMVDVLCGLLSGAGASPSIGPLYDAYDEPMRLGHFVAAIDISAFQDPAAFRDRLDDVIDGLKDVESRDGSEIKVPGEIETETLVERSADGIPIPPGVFEDLERLAARFDVPAPTDLQS